MKQNLMAAAIALGLLAACGGDTEVADDAVPADLPEAVEPAAAGATATVDLLDPAGQSVGTATLTETNGTVQIAVQVHGLPEGEHGIHLHETGTCTAPEFASAGGHFNPTQQQHGLENPQGPHGGDLQNLEIAADSTGTANLMNERVQLSAGANSLLDADGTAIVIHAGPDDQVTDPSGDSGARIACGVVTAG